MGHKTRLSVIIPTVGRPSIGRMIRSLQDLDDDDEIIVVGSAEALEFTQNLKLQVPLAKLRFLECDPGNDWGHTERQYAMQFAEKDYLVFGDDDDSFLVRAIHQIKHVIDTYFGRPVMFRMVDPGGAVLWVNQEIKMGNHGTPQFIVPNNQSLLGTWGNRYEGDFDFVVSTLAKYPPDSLIWSHALIYGCRGFGREVS